MRYTDERDRQDLKERSTMTWSWWQTALVLGLLGVSITIFVAAIAHPTPGAPALETDRPDALLALKDDAVVVVRLRVDDFA